MTNQPNPKPEGGGCSGLMWWTTLTVAVFAVPMFAFAVVSASRTTGIMQMALFVLSCWLCTYLGMKLMHLPGMHRPIRPRKEP